MRTVGIILNPKSRINKQNPQLLTQIRDLCSEQHFVAVSQDLADLTKIIEKFKRKGIDIIAISGGDGTISQTLSAVAKVFEKDYPKVLLLRAGTMNIMSRSLKTKPDIIGLLRQVFHEIEIGKELKLVKVTSLSVQDRIGFIYADGSSIPILREYYHKKNGKMGMAHLGLKLLISSSYSGKLFRKLIQSRTVTLELDNQRTLSGQSIGLLASSLPNVPFGIKMFHNQNLRLHREFSIVSLTSPTKHLFPTLPMILFTESSSSGSLGRYSSNTSTLTIERESSFEYTLDGELFNSENEQLKIVIGPTFQFIC